MNPSKLAAAPALFVLAASLTNCSADLLGADTEGSKCDVTTASTDTLVNANVRLLLQASAELKATASVAKGTVLKACANIATDLGGKDSWTALGDSDGALSNAQGTGACNVAAGRIKAIMEASVSANFALVVTKGACYPDFAAQAKCDAQCNADAKCDSGTTETRCEPAALSCKCDTVCKAGSSCRGTVSVEANCNGKCEATCTGECKGTCTGANGKKTEGDKNCKGKCSSSCNGKCAGECKIEVEAGVSCGVEVRCKGQCQGTYTEPKCETTFTPPTCVVDASCIASCSSSVAAKAVCDPPSVDLLCDATVSADVAKLVATIRANLPAVIGAAQIQGKLVLEAALRLRAAGEGVVKASGDLNAKSIACAVGGTEVAVQAGASLNVTVQGGAEVTDSCASRAN